MSCIFSSRRLHGDILMMYASAVGSCMWLLKADPERRKRRSGSTIRYTSSEPLPLNAYHQICLYKTLWHATTENISQAQLPEQINLEDMIENIQSNPPYSDIPALPPPTAAYSCLQPPIVGYWWRQAGVAGLVRNPNVNHQQKSKSKIGERSDPRKY